MEKKRSKEKNEWRLAPGVEPLTPERLALVWMWTPNTDDAEWTGVLDVVGNLQNLLLPIGALQFYGSADSIRKKIIDVLEAVAIFRNFPGPIVPTLDGGLRAVSALDGSDLERFAANLQRIYFRLVDAEKKLKSDGWRFDTEGRRIKSIMVKGQPGNRPQLFLNRCIEAAHDHLQASVEKGQAMRDAIANILSPFFPAGSLDPKPHGNIENILGNYLRKEPSVIVPPKTR